MIKNLILEFKQNTKMQSCLQEIFILLFDLQHNYKALTATFKVHKQVGISYCLQNFMQSGNIKVFARVRPLNQKQLQADSSTCIASLEPQSIKLREAGSISSANQTLFTFDRVFSSTSSQKQVFDIVARDLLDSVFEGINGTVFAYGQTSSGKTYTCMGPDISDKEQKGLIPRLVQDIFQRILEAPNYIEFRLKLSFVEIYMEKLRDLIDISRVGLKIRQSKTRGIYIENCSELYVSSVEQVVKFIQIASSNRSLGHTNMNEASSRSHMVLFLTISQNNLQDLSAKSAKLTIIDLAGSEKVGKTGAEGKLLEEAKQINKSLSALGNVINALTQAKIGHVPYRDSKLTRILQESLGGNAKTSLIINVSPSILNDAETLSTLRFGYRAKNIKNSPKVNREYTVAELLVLLEKAEFKIKDLERLLKDNNSKGGQSKVLERREEMDAGVGSDQEDAPKQPYKTEEVQQQLLLPVQQSPVAREVSNEVGVETTQVFLTGEQDLTKLRDSYNDKLARLLQQIDELNSKNTELSRNYDLEVEKNSAFKLEQGFLQARMAALQKQNQQLMQESMRTEAKVPELLEKLQDAEQRLQAQQQSHAQMQKEVERLNKLSELGIPVRQTRQPTEKQGKISELFGETKKYSAPEASNDIYERLKQLQEENALYKHLEEEKNRFLAERSQFEQQKNKMYRDLENRVQKVVVLEEMLDDERERNQCLLRNINLDDKSKTKRIVNLEAYITELSTSYYVLKNQQSTWQADHSIFENKLRRRNDRIAELERELSSTKGVLYTLKLQYDELVQATKKDSEKIQPNIVKVLRSSISSRVNQSIN